MKAIAAILEADESILVDAKISKTFYSSIISLYLLGIILFIIGYEYEIGIIGVVLLLRTAYIHNQEIKEKASYHALLTQKRLIILKGYKSSEIFPIPFEEIKTIYVKPLNKRLQRFLDVGSIEVLTQSGGRYVIEHIKNPYAYHKAIIGDIVAATHYDNLSKVKRKR